jgi:hypothetical protein
MTTSATGTERAALAAEAYLFGFPLVCNLGQVRRFTRAGIGSLAPGPFNAFAHATQLAGPQDTFVSINNDTVYSVAPLDLSVGPLRLEVPDTADRYYVLQFVDAWTDNFAYLGRRATGTAAAAYWIVPPDWTDPLPGADGVIRSPTTVAIIVGRWAVDGADDLGEVRRLQEQLRLEPLLEGARGAGLPPLDPGVPEELAFFERLRVWSQAFPPAPSEQEHLQRFAALGVLDAETPYRDPPAEPAAALREGAESGRARVEEALVQMPSPEQNGWKLSFHVFDYNNDYFEIGTLDGPEWRIADRDAARVARAASARAGLWGNHAYEAAYAMTWTDDAGELLRGDQRYTLRFEQPPPVDAFWSVTMYDLPEFFLVANPSDRYSIGDRTRGLRHDDDGALTIVIQHDDPAGAERSNWLPAPAGAFRPILRLYQPAPAIFDGSYELPPIVHRGARAG